jgi:hypothetical protein
MNLEINLGNISYIIQDTQNNSEKLKLNKAKKAIKDILSILKNNKN